ncbi:hypothetical protein HETIRDRAFT_322943 [Heterobasidion irregulare TC 32-1]|uniref:Uncharacterized protein n=1 Tax=Heterobasidion irregulare (strain TC 32-1) TaxID=747525 RepID=W4K0X2_HETIT|nr:uncharacterized protein HETIRDRAFT_322943 [Heterobasidion irregulare TC 32-1]ETW79478.1 hypothetical protein HETIRDRAFT_322943 [Heterobasidion irregulare TC 32-1]
MSPIILDTVGPLSCGSTSTPIAFRAVNARYSFSLDTKRREAQVKDAIPPNAQDVANCIVTGDSATESPIHLCHVSHERHWSNHHMLNLSRLERAWGMKYDTIQMDGESNTISRAYSSLRYFLSLTLWDRWVKFDPLDGHVPSIEDMYDGAETFEYRLVPLFPDVPSISHRNKAEDGPESDESSGNPVHSYPFDYLPPIFSRVKSHFVVYDAGRKIDSISLQTYRTTSDIARIYGVSQEKAERVTTVVYAAYCTWSNHVHPATFVISPRIIDSRSRSSLIRPGQPNCAPQAGRPKKRCRATGEVIDAVYLQPNVVRYATSLSRVSPCGSDVLIVGDPGWDTEVDAEYEKKQLHRVIKASKRWARECHRESLSSGGWVSCLTHDEQLKSYRQEPSWPVLSTM